MCQAPLASELFYQALLLLADVLGNGDMDRDQLVASFSIDRHSFSPHAESGPRLSSRGNLQLNLAIDGSNAYPST